MTPTEKFPQVDHDEVTGELRSVYEDIHATLRLPWVAFGIRVLSTFPAFVPLAWRALKPNMTTLYAERAADEVRRASIVPGGSPPDPRPTLRELGWDDDRIAALNRALDALNYGNPKYLLLMTAWNEAFHDRVAGGDGELSEQDATQIPSGLPNGVDKFHLVDPDTASREVQELLRRVKDAQLHHAPASDWRVLAAWPDYLKLALEDSLAPVLQTRAYDETSWQIREIARERVRGFPRQGGVSRRELAHDCSPSEIAGLTGLLFMYQRFISDITVSVIRLKQAFEGPESASESKFPVE